MTRTQKKPERDKRVLSLFLILLPSLILAGNWTSNIYASIGLKALVLLLQFVLLKNFLDSHYGYQ